MGLKKVTKQEYLNFVNNYKERLISDNVLICDPPLKEIWTKDNKMVAKVIMSECSSIIKPNEYFIEK